MTLNKRDQTIAFIVGGAVIVYILYAFVLSALYFNPLKNIEKKIALQKTKLADDKKLLENKAANDEEWKSLQEKGLLEDQSLAASQFSNAVFTIANNSRGFRLLNWNAPNGRTSNPKSDFDEMRFQATGSGTTRFVGAFLLALESAGLPMRLDDISITTKKDGTDDLNVEMTLTALVYAPKVNGKPIRAVTSTRPTTGPTSRRAPGPLPPMSGTLSGTGRGATGRGATGRGTTAAVPASMPVLSPDAENDIVARLKAKREAENGGMTAPVTPGATPTTTPTGGVQ